MDSLTRPSPVDPGGAPAPALDTCPRCGGGFHCGAADAAPCACSTLTLSAALQAELRLRYCGCLCLGCLRELAAAAVAGSGEPA